MKLESAILNVSLVLTLTLQAAWGLDAPQPPADVVQPELGLISRADKEVGTNASAETEEESNQKEFRDIVKVGGDVVLKADQTSKDVVVVRGSATIDGTIEGDLVVVLGAATVNGTIKGDMVVVLGSAKLGPKAEVKRGATIVGGKLDADPEAKIGGQRVEITAAKVPGLGPLTDWFKHGFFLARPLPPQVGWVWIVAIVMFLINLLLCVMFPRPIQACIDRVEKNPIGSFFSGILALILFSPLAILLVATGVGIVIIPFLVCALVVAYLFGKVAVYRYAGLQIVRPMSSAVAQSALLTLVAGTVIFYLLYMVPVIGFVVWGVAGVWGLGAVLLAAIGSFRRERTSPASGASNSGTAPAFAMPLAGSNPPPISAEPTVPLAGSNPPIITTESTLPRVGFWLRFLASVLDLLLIGTISAWMHLPRWFLILFGIYHLAMWTWKGTTIGGIVLGIKVVRVDGRPLGFAVALIRCLASVFSAMALFVGFFWAGWSREKQSWHDKIAGTIVVKVPKAMSLV
ncbi:MAG: RDD family protein [Verrucomicrobia bacterium]|nr:RDD family protein [Verrucomicrobiota bacterium]